MTYRAHMYVFTTRIYSVGTTVERQAFKAKSSSHWGRLRGTRKLCARKVTFCRIHSEAWLLSLADHPWVYCRFVTSDI